MIQRRLLVLAALALVTACRTPANAAGDGGHPRVKKTAHGKAAPMKTAVVEFDPAGRAPLEVEVELALTEAQHERGLMFRKHLEEGHGMLFVFKDDDDRTFWMKNTLIPLDMIFVSHDLKVVGVVHHADPLTTTARSVGAPSRYVIEVPGDWARAHGIGRGTPVRFQGVPRRP